MRFARGGYRVKQVALRARLIIDDVMSAFIAYEDPYPHRPVPAWLFSFGVQAKASNHWSGRLEAVMSGSKNPFTGKTSFQSNAGQTIDEPGSINQTSFRLAVVYHFGGPKATSAPPTMAQHN